MDDVKNLAVQSAAVNIASDVLKGTISNLANFMPATAVWKGILSVAGVLDSTWDKIQVYDPTQRRYDLQITYGNNAGFPRYHIWLKFREGQFTNENGVREYGVVQATYQISEKINEDREWVPIKTIRSHEGEDNGFNDPA